MSKILISSNYMENIANAIRAKLNNSIKYKPYEMANAIEAISNDDGTASFIEAGEVEGIIWDEVNTRYTITPQTIGGDIVYGSSTNNKCSQPIELSHDYQYVFLWAGYADNYVPVIFLDENYKIVNFIAQKADTKIIYRTIFTMPDNAKYVQLGARVKNIPICPVGLYYIDKNAMIEDMTGGYDSFEGAFYGDPEPIIGQVINKTTSQYNGYWRKYVKANEVYIYGGITDYDGFYATMLALSPSNIVIKYDYKSVGGNNGAHSGIIRCNAQMDTLNIYTRPGDITVANFDKNRLFNSLCILKIS